MLSTDTGYSQLKQNNKYFSTFLTLHNFLISIDECIEVFLSERAIQRDISFIIHSKIIQILTSKNVCKNLVR